MDSLIVLRRPLRKTQLEPKFLIPKTKKALPKLGAFPPTPSCNLPPISFVKLYKDVCMENARRATGLHVRHSPTRMRLNVPESVYEELSSREHLHRPSRCYVELEQLEQPEWALASLCHVNTAASPASSGASLRTTNCAPPARRQLYADLPQSRKARAELILELDYNTSSKDSGFY